MIQNRLEMKFRCFKNRFVWLKGNGGSGTRRFSNRFHLCLWFSTSIFLHPKLSFTLHVCSNIGRKRVHDRNTDPVKSTGNFVSFPAEFSSGVEFGHHKFQCRNFKLRMHVYRNSTSVIFHTHHVVRKKGERDLFSVSGHGFIKRVVHDFPDQVV